jgi:integrase
MIIGMSSKDGTMRKALTDRTIAALKPGQKRYEVRDSYLPCFGLRVSTNGRKTFFANYRFGTKQRRKTIGVYPRIKLAEARLEATEILRLVDAGSDPSYVTQTHTMSVAEAVECFIRQYAKPRNRNWKETERVLEREFVNRFRDKDIRDVDRTDVLRILDAAVGRGANIQANRIHSMIRKMFNWFIERGIIEKSPIVGLSRPSKEVTRDRVLDDDEISRLLAACEAEPYPFGPYILMLLSTAQRRSEVANMRWSQIDIENQTWTIPSELSKNGKPHVVPLNSVALTVIESMPRFAMCGLIFSTTGKTSISGMSKMLRRIQLASNTSNWRLHDLRRTAASRMAQNRVAPHVIEKVLNHMTGTIAGVAAVYNRYGYDDEKRQALNLWGKFLEQRQNGQE